MPQPGQRCSTYAVVVVAYPGATGQLPFNHSAPPPVPKIMSSDCVEALDPDGITGDCKPNPDCANVASWDPVNPQPCESLDKSRRGHCDANGYVPDNTRCSCTLRAHCSLWLAGWLAVARNKCRLLLGGGPHSVTTVPNVLQVLLRWGEPLGPGSQIR